MEDENFDKLDRLGLYMYANYPHVVFSEKVVEIAYLADWHHCFLYQKQITNFEWLNVNDWPTIVDKDYIKVNSELTKEEMLATDYAITQLTLVFSEDTYKKIIKSTYPIIKTKNKEKINLIQKAKEYKKEKIQKKMNNKDKNILSLDLGGIMGWAAIADNDSISSGTIDLKENRYSGGGMRFLKMQQFLDKMKESTTFSLITFEEVRRHLGVDAAHVYGGYLATLEIWCEHNEIPYTGVPVGTIKKSICGKGNASKQDVVNAVRAKGHTPRDDNEADAIALLYYSINEFK